MFKFGSKVAYKKQARISRAPRDYDALIKLLMIGDAGVGKSCLLLRFADDNFFTESYITTIGVDFKIKTVEVDGKQVKLQCWDTTGQERFRTITSSYYRGAHAVLIVYDTTDRQSFSNVSHWVQEMQRQCSAQTSVSVLGSKCDLERERQVPKEEADKWCSLQQLPHHHVSAKTGFGVEEAFLGIARTCLQSLGSASANSKRSAVSAPPAARNAAYSSDEESFSDSDLDEDVQLFGKKNKKKDKKSTSRLRHKKTDGNVCRLNLATLTQGTEVATGEPIKCGGCNAIMCASSVKHVGRDPSALLKRRQVEEAALAKRQGGSKVQGKQANMGKAKGKGKKQKEGSFLGSLGSLWRSTFSSGGAKSEASTSTASSSPSKLSDKETEKEDETEEQEQPPVLPSTAPSTRKLLLTSEPFNAYEAVDAGDGAVGPQAEAGEGDAEGDEGVVGPGGGEALEEKEEEEGEEEMKEEEGEGELFWVCEFCDHFNAVDEEVLEEGVLPKEDTFDYLLEPPPQGSSEEGNVIFVIDISGSMCVTTSVQGSVNFKGGGERGAVATGLSEAEQRDLGIFAGGGRGRFGGQYLPGQSRNVTYVSRLQCVQTAVEAQIKRIAREHPNKRVGLIAFSSRVNLIGDGRQPRVEVAGDRLKDWEQLNTLASQFHIGSTVAEAEEGLLEALWELNEEGATALGPALQLGIGVAGAAPASSVVLCTDGLANVGLGSLEGDKDTLTMYYTELAEKAKLTGTSVNIITLEGTQAALEQLSVVAAATGGDVTRVDPLSLTREIDGILGNRTLATACFALILLHKGLQFRGELEDEADPTRNWLVRDVGNVTQQTEASFSYGFRSLDVCDLRNKAQVPFQVQVTYTRKDGGKYLRVATTSISLTEKKEESEASADLRLIGSYAAQKAARYAKEGNYEAAQMEARSASSFMVRNRVQQSELSHWQQNIGKMDRAIKMERLQERSEELQDQAQSFSMRARSVEKKSKMRRFKRGKADKVAALIHKQVGHSSSSWTA